MLTLSSLLSLHNLQTISCPRGQDIETHYSAPTHSQFCPKELWEVPVLSSPERFWNCKLKRTQGQFQVPRLLRHWKIPGVLLGMLLPFHSSSWNSERNSLLSHLGTAFSATLGVFCGLFGGKNYILQPLFGGFTKLHEPVLFAEFVASSGRAFQVMLGAKRLPANAGDVRDTGLIPGLGRSPEEGNVNPLQYSYLEKPTERGAWQAIVQRVEKSWTPLRQFSTAWTGSRVSKLLNWRIWLARI